VEIKLRHESHSHRVSVEEVTDKTIELVGALKEQLEA
jgi:hypothetical protein